MLDENYQALVESCYTKLSQIAIKFPDIQSTCTKAINDFQVKHDRAIDKGRLMSLAVIGQVNAGKSSFLNTILFEGQEVLPKAATPKTAKLTFIRYDKTCRIEVEFYNAGEWKNLKEQAFEYENERKKYEQKQAGNPEFANRPFIYNNDNNKAAYQIIEMADSNGLDVDSIISQKREVIQFNSRAEMCDQLDQFVGESGRLTPITKEVWLYLDDERLIDMEIIDTPGLNDPVPARTTRTTELVKKVDIAFFLAQTAGDFMNETDFNLLTKTFPSEGIKRIELIGSQLDMVMMELDCSEFHSLEEALSHIEKKYKSHIKRSLDAKIKELESNNPRIRELLSKCYSPTYMSAMVYNIANKSSENYDDDENLTYEYLQKSAKHWSDLTLDKECLTKLSNIPCIVQNLESIRKDKMKILENSLRDLLPDEAGKITLLIQDTLSAAITHKEMLMSNDLASLKTQDAVLAKRIDGIRAGVSEVIGDIISKCTSQSASIEKDLRDDIGKMTTVKEQMGTREIESSYSSPTQHSIFWGAISWTSYKSVSYTKSVSYRYASVNSALDNLRKCANQATTIINGMFLALIEQQSLRKDLLKVIMSNFDTDSECFSANFFKVEIQKVLQKISLPKVKIDADEEVTQMANNFPNPQYEDGGIDKMNSALSQSLYKISDYIIEEMNKKEIEFKNCLKGIIAELSNLLIESVDSELQRLKVDLANKEEAIAEYQKCIESCENLKLRVTQELRANATTQ